MKKVYSLVLVLLVCVCTFFTSCGGNSGLANNPVTNASVYGNGSIAVTKGDYLYFINGYEDSSTFTSYKIDNVQGKVFRSAIYRTKLDASGNVLRDENGFLENADMVVSKTVGFKNGGFYIVGDYIYYLTPHMENDESGKLQSTWIDICKININGAGSSTRLYYTKSEPSNFQWGAYLINEKTYITLLDGTNLISINATDNKSVTIAENVKSVAFAKYDEFKYENVQSYDKYIFYTRDKNDDDKVSLGFTGNIVCKVSITDKNDTESYVINDETNLKSNFKIVKYSLGEVYYEKYNTTDSTSVFLYKRNIKSNNFKVASEIQLTQGVYSDYIIVDLDNNSLTTTYVVGVDANKIVNLITKNSTSSARPVSTKIYEASAEIKFVCEENGKIYYIDNSALYSIDYLNGEQTPVKITNADKTYKTDVENLISVVGNKVYILAEYTAENSTEEKANKNYYLNQITTTLTDDKAQFVGVFAKYETPANPNDKLGEEEEAVLPWLK